MSNAKDRRTVRARFNAPLDPIARDDHLVDDPRELGGQLEVIYVVASSKEVQRVWVALGQVVADDRILGDHDLADVRKISIRRGDHDASIFDVF